MFLSSGDGYVGELLEMHEACQGPFRGSRGKISLKTPQQKRASSHIEGRISWFLVSCSRKHGVPLELGQGLQGPSHVASGKSSLLASCKGLLGIPLHRCRVQGPHLELRPQPQGSSPLLTWISGFLWSFYRGVKPRLEWRHASLLSSPAVTVVSGFLSS